MEFMKKLFIIIAVILLPVFFMSCEEEGESGPGTLVLSITDSPVDSSGVTGVYITINEIQVHTVGNSWVTMDDFDGPRKFNLLDLTRGESDMLGSISLEGGRYTQIRFILDAPVRGNSRPANPSCYIEFNDGSTVPLFVPSGSQSGFKAVGSFTVPVNGTVNMTADFDVRKSIVKTGSPTPRYILKPVIRLVVENQAGQIRGNVTNIPENTGIVVYSYEDGIYKDEEALTPPADSSRFPNAVSSDMVDSLGVYHLAFLAAGKYDLVVTSVANGEFNSVLGKIEDVIVESRKTTQQNIDISLLK
jgi:hypothetical protein